MMKTLRLLALLIFVANNTSFGQAVAGEIYGRVTDEKGEGLDFATVQAFQGGILKGGAKTDLNGNYSIKPLQPGEYTVKISFVGMVTEEISGIPLGNEGRRKVDAKLEKKPAATPKGEVVIKASRYRKPLVDPGDPSSGVMVGADIKKAPTLNTTDMVSMMGGTYQRKQGDNNLSVGGDRSSSTLVIVDGIPLRAGRSANFPPAAIDRLELMSNGLSAKYGNATGAVIGITTRGIQKELSGGLQYQHSVDGYNNNMVSLDLSGPLISKKDGGVKRPVIGFVINASGTYDKDNNPYYYKLNRIKKDKLKEIQETPIIPNPNGTGSFVRAGEMITTDDMEKARAKEYGQTYGLNYLGKLDYQPTENINVTLGSYLTYSYGRGWAFSNSLFAPEANQISKAYSGRGFLRLYQRLGKPSSKEKDDSKKSAIKNAYYSLQFSYQKDYSEGANPTHKRDIFNYGYLGKFTTYRRPIYTIDTAAGGFMGIKYLGDFSDSVTFQPAGINPLLENYTKAVYADGRFPINNLTDIQRYLGLRNGDAPQSNYSLWTGVGAQISGYSYSEVDQVSINLDASLDILQGSKNNKRIDPITHNILFEFFGRIQVQIGYYV